MTLEKFIEDKLTAYTGTIEVGSAWTDEHALGELTFYMALRRVLAGTGTPQDMGMMDAVNDVLQHKGMVKKGASFLK